MDEWWRLAHDLLIAEGVTRERFRQFVADHGSFLHFRERTNELVTLLRRRNIPFLVLSAGLGDLIDAVVERETSWGKAHVVSNHLAYGHDGVATHFAHKNVTTFNKSEAMLQELHPAWEGEVRARRHVILLGDSIGDAHMAEGVPHDCVLKIGFLNHGQESSLAEFSAAFDVVLQCDNTFDYVLDVLSQIDD